MTPEERRASIRALSAGDRGAFRRLFRMRRNPTPDTPRNETLEGQLARVRLAESNFRQDGYGGGATGRGFPAARPAGADDPAAGDRGLPGRPPRVYPPDEDGGVPAPGRPRTS